MIKIHYHTDCPFFAGCENMLANFFNSDDFRKQYNVSFSYRYSESYTQGFKKRITGKLPTYPLFFPDLTNFSFLPKFLTPILRRVLTIFLRQLLIAPVFLFQLCVLFNLLKKLKPDILHINNGGYPGALSSRAAAIAAKLAGVPSVLMVVNNMAVDYKRVSRWPDYFFDYLIGCSINLFITGSLAAASKLRIVLSLSNEKVITIHNGIANRKSSASAEANRERLGVNEFSGVIFGVVALLIPRKGHQVLLDAILSLVKEKKLKDDCFKFLIEGNGDLRKVLADFVKNNHLTHLVEFVGDESNIIDFMSVLDVLILPSIQDEDFPNVILEAMSLGKPVIASKLAGTIEQIVNGETGILVEPSSVEQLCEAICYCVENQHLLADMGRAGLRRFNGNFTSETVLANYSKMYNKIFGMQN